MKKFNKTDLDTKKSRKNQTRTKEIQGKKQKPTKTLQIW